MQGLAQYDPQTHSEGYLSTKAVSSPQPLGQNAALCLCETSKDNLFAVICEQTTRDTTVLWYWISSCHPVFWVGETNGKMRLNAHSLKPPKPQHNNVTYTPSSLYMYMHTHTYILCIYKHIYVQHIFLFWNLFSCVAPSHLPMLHCLQTMIIGWSMQKVSSDWLTCTCACGSQNSPLWRILCLVPKNGFMV